jgi:aspartate/methionine/tyrosine aminotransferase
MNSRPRTKRSEYMEWAKTCSQARFNLATSGLTNVRMADFPLCLEDLEITTADGYGYKPLLERLARHTGAPEECIVTAAGTSMANHLAMAAVLDPGDEVAIEQPTYGLLVDVANYLGANVKRFTRKFEDGFAIEPAEIAETVTEKTRLIVLTNLHNPSGALVKIEALQTIAEIAARVGAHVLVDEVYLELLYHDDAPFCFDLGQKFSRGHENPFIVTSSLTKAYGLSGLRCGWILAPPQLAKQIWLLDDLFAASPAHSAERMSVTALDRLEGFRNRARALLQINRGLLDAFLDSRADLECFRPLTSTVVFPRLPCTDSERFFKLLREKYQTTVVPGKFFEMPQHFRLGIGGETGELSAGLDCLAAALDKVAG